MDHLDPNKASISADLRRDAHGYVKMCCVFGTVAVLFLLSSGALKPTTGEAPPVLRVCYMRAVRVSCSTSEALLIMYFRTSTSQHKIVSLFSYGAESSMRSSCLSGALKAVTHRMVYPIDK